MSIALNPPQSFAHRITGTRMAGWCLLMFGFFLPIQDLPVIGTYGAKVTGGLFTVLVLTTQLRKITVFRSDSQWFAWLGWSLLSLAWCVDFKMAFDNVTYVLQFMLLAFCVMQFVGKNPEFVVPFFWAVSLGACVQTLDVYRSIENILIKGRALAGDYGINAYANTMVIPSVFLAYRLTSKGLKLVQRIPQIAVLGFLLSGILVSGSRGASLSLVLTLMVLLGMVFWRNKGLALILFAFVATTVTIMVTQVPFIQSVIERRFTAAAIGEADRPYIWSTAISIWTERPLHGHGFRNFSQTFTVEAIAKSKVGANVGSDIMGNGKGSDSHSTYFAILVETGLIGLLLYCYWMYSLIFYRAKSDLTRPMCVMGSLITFGMSISALTGTLVNVRYFWVAIGLAEAFRLADRIASRQQTPQALESPNS